MCFLRPPPRGAGLGRVTPRLAKRVRPFRMPPWLHLSYLRGVLLVAVATLLWRSWCGWHFTFLFDDWAYIARADQLGLAQFLTQSYNRHFMPGTFLLAWIMIKLGSLSFGLIAVVDAVLSSLSIVVWGLALREIFGPQRKALFVLLGIAASPSMTWSTLWWASALQAAPLQLATAAGVFFAARWARSPSTAVLTRLVLVFVVGLVFWEKALLIVIPVTAVLVAASAGSLRARIRSSLRPAAVLLGVSALYLVLYGVVSTHASGEWYAARKVPPNLSPGGLLDALVAAGGSMRDIEAQALFGGPWGSVPVNAFALHPAAGLIRLTVAAVACAGLLAALLLRRWAWLPLLMATSYALTALVLTLFSTSYSNFGLDAMQDARFHSDSISIWWLAVAMIVMPSRAEQQTDESLVRRPTGLAMGLRSVNAAWLAALVALAAGGAIANGQLFYQTKDPPGRAWTQHVRADVDRLGPVLIVEGRPPTAVFPWGFWPEEGWLSRMLSPFPEAKFEGISERLYVVSSSGKLVPGEVGAAAQTTQGPVAGCGYAVGEGPPVGLGLAKTLASWPWGFQLDVFSGRAGTLRVWIDGRLSSVHIPQGLSHLEGVHNGRVTSVSAQTAEGSGVICVVGLRFGAVSPTHASHTS